MDGVQTRSHVPYRGRVVGVVGWLERHQVSLYLLAIVGGAAVGWLLPGSDGLQVAVNPVLGLLLLATFAAVPFAAIRRAATDLRFLAALLVLNFVVVPVVVFGLSRPVTWDPAILVGFVLVLVCPCVDYVIVFSGLAGGARERLLAASPILLIIQLVLLPVYLYLLVGPQVIGVIQAGPFAEAFLSLIVLPLLGAILLQRLSPRLGVAKVALTGLNALMVPLMMVTLAVVVGSQARTVGSRLDVVAGVVPLYAAFLAAMALLGTLVARLFRFDHHAGRALVFSGATRNSLVVLPLALALPGQGSLAAAAVVTQTLVELVGMVVGVRVVPRLLPAD